MMRKVFGIILALALCASLTVPVFAADDTTGDTTLDGYGDGRIHADNNISVTLDGTVKQEIQGSDGFVYTLSTLTPENNDGAQYLGTVERHSSYSDYTMPVTVFLVDDWVSYSYFGFSVNKPASLTASGHQYFAESDGAGGFGPDIYNADFKRISDYGPEGDGKAVAVEANQPVYVQLDSSNRVGYVQHCTITVISDNKGVDELSLNIMLICNEFAEEIMQNDIPGVFPSDWDDSVLTYHGLAELLTKAGFGTPEKPSSWAVESVNAAIAAKLVPATLQSKYTQATTRAEFCALAVALYETVTGKEITDRKTFDDTKDVNVEKAAAIGVVSGVGDNKFSPDNQLTREQAAVMLARLADAIGKPLAKQAATFADNGSISSWAVEQVGQIQAAGIMSGVGNNTFAPQNPYTREQSIITIMRLYDVVK